jgi:uncharacterized protein DUF6982
VSIEQDRGDLLKVVARGRSGDMVKGYLESVTDLDKFRDTSLNAYEIRICPADSSTTSALKVDTLKAVFFVKSFDGNSDYREAQYFTEAPIYPGIWVRVRFFDQEVMEGIMENSIRSFMEPGLLITLPDAESNNEAAYVIKSALHELQILGVNASFPKSKDVAS